MNDWTSGYVTEIEYTYGYYFVLNPLRVNLAFLNAGLIAPEFGTACELGFGQGLSTNIHASASVTQWHGTDFNPSQAGFAQELALAGDTGARLYDEAFDEFCNRSDLPDFDYIALHGIWSWITSEDRQVIVEFIRKKLKVGGVLYISYNTLPGWAAFAPMRYLMSEHAQVMGSSGQGVISRINDALEFSNKLMKTNATYARNIPSVVERLNGLQSLDRHYLAHEYFNKNWLPMHFSEIEQWLEPTKLEFACSAKYLDAVDEINLTREQIAFLNGIPDPIFRETTRDFMVNQQFRSDYWVKGARKLSKLAQAEALRSHKIILVTPRPDISTKVKGALGEATFSETVHTSILDCLSDYQPKTLGQIEQEVKEKDVTFAQLMQAVLLLSGAGHLDLVQDERVIAKAKKQTDKLNAHLCKKARGSNELTYLASPVTGGGVAVNRFQQMFLVSIAQGLKQPADWAQAVWQVLDIQGQKVSKEGKVMETPEENLTELTAQAQSFAEKLLPILKALQVI